MKAFFRISGLLIAVLLILVMVPDTIGWQMQGEQLRILSPVVLASPPYRSPPNLEDIAPLEAPQHAEVATPEPLGVPQPTPAPTLEARLVVPAENHALEAREVRRAISAAARTPTAVSTPADPHETDLALAPEPLDVYIHLPPGAAAHQPLRILLVLHGMGGRGDKFSEELVSTTDRNNWVVVAPTLPYNSNYMDPNQIMQEDVMLARSLHRLLENLPKRLGLKLCKHILIFGFSRGAQLGHRLAFFFPEHVESVAVFSAGTYTLPMAKDTGSGTRVMTFPYGLGDVNKLMGAPEDWDCLKTVSFWIGVGEKDTRSGDVPRAFDAYVGQNRVERARMFYKTLQDIGVDAHLVIFPNADHEITTEMRKSALDFLRQDELNDSLND